MFEAKHAKEQGLPPHPGSPLKLNLIDANGITKRLNTIRAVTPAREQQADRSKSTEQGFFGTFFHNVIGTQKRFETSTERPSPGDKMDTNRNGSDCPLEE